MSELPKWPEKADYTFTPCWYDAAGEHQAGEPYLDNALYERARAYAWESRCRAAVPLLERMYGQLAITLNINPREEQLHDDIFDALEAIGELPA